MQELLGACGHHNIKARRKALEGLASLCTRHPTTLHASLSDILTVAAARSSDSDSAVRTALRGLWTDVFVVQLSQAQLSPFAPMLIAHACAAATNLDVAIRLDAFALLQLIVAACPRLAAARYGTQLLRLFGSSLAPVCAHTALHVQSQACHLCATL